MGWVVPNRKDDGNRYGQRECVTGTFLIFRASSIKLATDKKIGTISPATINCFTIRFTFVASGAYLNWKKETDTVACRGRSGWRRMGPGQFLCRGNPAWLPSSGRTRRSAPTSTSG